MLEPMMGDVGGRMDRAKLSYLLLFLLIPACAKSQKFEQNVFPQSSATCQEDAVKGRYIARKTDGTIHVVRANSRQEMLENYVRPHLKELDLVEADYLIHLEVEKITKTPAPNSTTWGPDRIGAANAWGKNINGQGVIVAVVDSGVDITHPSLASQIYVNLAEKNGVAGVDDDKNGYVDDINGWNFVKNSPNASDLDTIPHGTHVSGIIAATHSSTNPMEGLAPQAKILPAQFITVLGVDSNGNPEESGYTSDAINAIEYAKKMGAKVINASWGSSYCSTLLQNEIDSLADSNVLFVSAAGNSGNDLARYPEYPAAIGAPTQMTVSAITINGYMADYSNYGLPSDVMAPGSGILSTVPGNQYAYMDGTSMATPMVSGMAALLLSANPQLKASDVKNVISQSVAKGLYNVRTQGEINVPAAMSLMGIQ